MHSKRFLYPLYILLLTALFSAGSENDVSTRTFKSLGPFGGDVRSLLIDSQDPRIVYLGTSSGRIFKSLDGGSNWRPLNPGIGQSTYVIDTLIQHPRERNHIFAGAWDLRSEGGGLFESKDAGLHWARMPLPSPVSAVRGMSICRREPEFMISGSLAGPMVSTDGGRNWRQVGGTDLQKAESVAIDPIDPKTLYVGTWRLGYKSTDFGKSWTLVDKGMPLDSDVFSIAVDPKNPAIVYTSACSGVYRSGNQAHSWTRLRLLKDRFTIRAQVVYIDPVNPQKVYSGTTEGLFVSNDDGQHWTQLTNSTVTVNAIQVNPENNQNILIGTEYQGTLKSNDGGGTWRESNAGFIHRQISWLDPDASGYIVAGLASGTGGIYSYDLKSGGWTASQILPGTRVLSFLNLPDKRGKLAGTTQGLFLRARDSESWVKLKGSIGKRTVYSLELDSGNPVVYAGTDQGIYRTSLSALDFRLPPGYRLSPLAWCITAPVSAKDVVYAGSSLGLLRSWDRGTIWNAISAYGLPDRTAIESVAVSPTEKNYLLAGTSVGLFESRNGGIHWKRLDDDRLGVRIPSVVFLDDAGRKIVAADAEKGGIFYSKDGGQNWDKIASEFLSPTTAIAKDPRHPDGIYLGTMADGVYYLDLP